MDANLDAFKVRSDPSARITRILRPAASPGKCAICGKDRHPEGFAATDNFDFEGYGTIYYCADCVGDYARIFGYMSRDQVQDLIDQLNRQSEELAVLRSSVVNLESIVDAYSSLRNIKPSDLPSNVPDDVSTESVNGRDDEGKGTALNETGTGEQESPTGEQSSDERSNEQGCDDVHDSTEHNVLAELGLT